MFDIGFFEILLIALVGLFVIGPERLPDTIKNIALWISRVKRTLLDTRQELEQQIGADDIRREIYNEQVLHNLEKMKDTKAELEQRINQWKDDALSTDAYLDKEPDEPDVSPSHQLESDGETKPNEASTDSPENASDDTQQKQSPQ